jgi:hypothetical protein
VTDTGGLVSIREDRLTALDATFLELEEAADGRASAPDIGVLADGVFGALVELDARCRA